MAYLICRGEISFAQMLAMWEVLAMAAGNWNGRAVALFLIPLAVPVLILWMIPATRAGMRRPFHAALLGSLAGLAVAPLWGLISLFATWGWKALAHEPTPDTADWVWIVCPPVGALIAAMFTWLHAVLVRQAEAGSLMRRGAGGENGVPNPLER